jgi:hypothetical protein
LYYFFLLCFITFFIIFLSIFIGSLENGESIIFIVPVSSAILLSLRYEFKPEGEVTGSIPTFD